MLKEKSCSGSVPTAIVAILYNRNNGGSSDVVYHLVPASRVERWGSLRFVYHTPDRIRAFTYAEVRDLPDLA